MARRSSARIRNRNSSTPKRVSLSHDAPLRTPRTAPVKLQALYEHDEMPGAFPGSPSPPLSPTNKPGPNLPKSTEISTPKDVTPVKPASEEMHPKHHQQSTAKPLDEARWLGFSHMERNTEPPKQSSKIAVLQGTPTKASKPAKERSSPRFEFSFGREQSLELSAEAKKLMSEKREEALKIREQMIADGEGLKDQKNLLGRKIATAKGKKGRFSEAHLEAFTKMDSIAGHASSFRADPKWQKPATTPPKPSGDTQTSESNIGQSSKSLKRSPSKAGLDEPSAPSSVVPGGQPTTTVAQLAENQSRTTTSKGQHDQDSPESSPAKRVKRAIADDVSTDRIAMSGNGTPHPTAPPPSVTQKKKHNYAAPSTFTTPTRASLARTASVKSVKSSKIPAPTLLGSPSKAVQKVQLSDSPKTLTPLLARSPSKAPLFSNPNVEKPEGTISPLLMRTPSKFSPLKKAGEAKEKEERKSEKTPLLSRSPFKLSKHQIAEASLAEKESSVSTPLLARSPVKLALLKEKHDAQTHQQPGDSPDSSLMGRFNLLHSSPMKSILRSPQRLYSNDPAKVAAGTHLASPIDATNNKAPVPSSSTAVIPTEKHVDFTSSTKARYERAQSETDNTPTQDQAHSSASNSEAKQSSATTAFANYPTLPTHNDRKIATAHKRRQTAAPGDFTFTSHGHGIIFGQSPNSPASALNSTRPLTIRHVSAEPQVAPARAPATGSKKRKFESESDEVLDADVAGGNSDKENADEAKNERPSKRMKSDAVPTLPQPPQTQPGKVVTRLPTLGVKPKKGANEVRKKPTTISRARLNALAQPKRKV